MPDILIIDGDVICYGACTNRWGPAEEQARREAGEIPPFTKEEDIEYLALCYNRLDSIIKQLMEITWSDHCKIAVKGVGNFREAIYPLYKANRVKKQRPVAPYVSALRDRCIEKYNAVPAHNMEADDLVRIWAEEAMAAGDKYIIASIDKDLLCIPGDHFRFKKGNPYQGMNDFSKASEAIISVDKITADRFYYEQILKGDSTDGIPGIPKVGDVRAKKFLADCVTEEDMQERVMEIYQDFYGKHWKTNLLITGSLITILPRLDYQFSINGWSNYNKFAEKEFE